MTIYKVSIEGQTLELQEEIAGKDETLKSALVPYFPGAANAKIMRMPEKDGVIDITVVKQAGTKGLNPSNPLKILIAAPASMNPLVQLHREMGRQLMANSSDEELLTMSKLIKKALGIGRDQAQKIDQALKYMQDAPAESSPTIPEGF